MWSRVVEVMLGCWLLVSPFVFRHAADRMEFWLADLLAGIAVIVCGLASFASPLRYAHIVTLATAAALIVFAVMASGGLGNSGNAPPALHNDVVLGLMLLTLALIPNEASRPPRSWRLEP